MGAANTTTVLTQRSPDTLWTVTHPVVGWKDESAIPRRVRMRSFTGEMLSASGESRLVLADAVGCFSFASGQDAVATSFRVDDCDVQRFQVVLPSGVFTTDPLLRPADDERATITALDGSTWLAVYIDGGSVVRASLTESDGQAAHADVVAELIPTPVARIHGGI